MATFEGYDLVRTEGSRTLHSKAVSELQDVKIGGCEPIAMIAFGMNRKVSGNRGFSEAVVVRGHQSNCDPGSHVLKKDPPDFTNAHV